MDDDQRQENPEAPKHGRSLSGMQGVYLAAGIGAAVWGLVIWGIVEIIHRLKR